MKRTIEVVINLILSITLVMSAAGWAQAGEWYENVKAYGDLRYRHESIQDENSIGVLSYRDRQRVRARVGLQGIIDDYWMGNIRLATSEAGFAGGNGDPVSVNQTLGDIDTKKPIWLDLAYIQYKVLFNNLILTAGKQPLPFEIVGKNKLIFKDDLTPEGISGNFKMDLMTDTSLFVNGAGFWIRESSSSYDPMLYAVQVGMKTKMDTLKVTAGVGEYFYTDLTKQYPLDYKTAAPTAAAPGNKLGNTLVAATGKYLNNYYIAQGFIEITYPIFDLPVKTYVDYALNNGAANFQKGYIAGLILNKADKEGTWEVGYNWRLLEKDAVVGQYCDSDFVGGSTDGSGHLISATYVPADNVKTTINFFRDQKAMSAAVNPFYNRFQAEVVVSF